MTLEVRPIEGEQELREFARVHATAFGHRWEDDKLENVILPWLPEVHAIAAFDGDTMVGASVDQPFEMTLPGGRMAPMRGITWVGVLPTHRGRGALRAMIEHQHASFREQGLAFSALFASETTIYGRFGYGPATVVQPRPRSTPGTASSRCRSRTPARSSCSRSRSPSPSCGR